RDVVGNPVHLAQLGVGGGHRGGDLLNQRGGSVADLLDGGAHFIEHPAQLDDGHGKQCHKDGEHACRYESCNVATTHECAASIPAWVPARFRTFLPKYLTHKCLSVLAFNRFWLQNSPRRVPRAVLCFKLCVLQALLLAASQGI